MDEKLLCQIGLTENQARVYRLLIERKSLRPNQLAKITNETRPNCYALLDKLVGLGLARRTDVDLKLTYFPESPVILEKLMSENVASAQRKLLSVQQALPRMLSAYDDRRTKTRVEQSSGKKELARLYERQMEVDDKQLYFIRSVADVPYFGFDEMDKIRHLARKFGKRRHGITPVVFSSPERLRNDSATNLKRTWLPKASYTAPVEWAVTGDMLQIINFRGEGSGVTIRDKEIAESFRQIFLLFSSYIKKDPEYLNNPKLKKN